MIKSFIVPPLKTAHIIREYDMNDFQIVDRLILLLGGADNISSVTNCMTRLRVSVKHESCVQEEELENTEKVISLIHDRPNRYEIVVGPGSSRKFADLCRARGLSAVSSSEDDQNQGRTDLPGEPKESTLQNRLKIFGDIFVPLIPGIITAGLCAGAASFIAQLIPNYKDITGWYLVWQLLTLIHMSFMVYINAWAGYRAAERFAATPILGGMLGMISSLSGINDISRLLGLYHQDSPLVSILQSGKGGVLAVLCGVFFLSHVEKFIRRRMPENLDVIFTPLLTILVCTIPYILIVMPAFGFVSTGIAWVIGKACVSDSIFIRILVGYLASAVFLPLVACGMHHGLIALYTVQLQEFGYVMLYPALAMAGGGQVGAAIALYRKARRLGNRKLRSVIGGTLPAALLGVGEPLIYGVTLPMGRPFLTAGLGAGFGGAFVTAFHVASTTWGVSGLLGVFVMTAGEGGALQSAALYAAGYAISCTMGFLITNAGIGDSMVSEALGGIDADKVSATVSHIMVTHGDAVRLDFEREYTLEHIVSDPCGIHARLACRLMKAAADFDAEITIRCGLHTASARSIIELMELGASKGSRLEIRIAGKDAPAAAQALHRFLIQNL